MGNRHQYENHCGRKIVSTLWDFCPYCGLSLESGQPAPVPTPKRKARAATKATTLRPDGEVRKSPLKAKKPALARAERPLICQHVCTRGPMKGQVCGALNKGKKHRHYYGRKVAVEDANLLGF